jgi:ATP-dependent DNA helicase DinG
LGRRGEQVAAWVALLARLAAGPDPDFVDWLQLVRVDSREMDCGLWRHWLDPTRPLAAAVLAPAHGVLVTSATLPAPLERAGGALHLAVSPRLFVVESPFDYAGAARVLVVTDVPRGDLAALATGYARMIEAAGGGALGLFTAVSRLRGVHGRIADRLARQGLPLYAQHVDPMDTGTLVDLFRADRRASLLGTDALRDGVDVPGSSLRLILFEGVPWSRPTLLNAARRAAYASLSDRPAQGGAAHEDQAVRGRLAQAFGRLIRRADDRGVFVLFGAQAPSRLLDSFPPGVAVRRLPLEAAVHEARGFFAEACAAPHASLTPEQSGGWGPE